MKNRLLVFLVAAGILTAGFLIYFLFRDDSILLNQLAHRGFSGTYFEFIRTSIQHLQLPHWLIYSLPDGLWMASLMIIVLLIWDFKIQFRTISWMTLAFVSGILTEVAQGMGWMRGTFDVTDLVLMLIGGLFPISFFLIKDRLCKTN